MAASFPPPPLIEPEDADWSATTASNPGDEDAYVAVLNRPEVQMSIVAKFSRRGIPDHVRATYWKLIIGYLPSKRDTWEEVQTLKEKEYNEIVGITCELDDKGHVSGGQSTGLARMIDVDIPRTMPCMHFFLTDEEMFSVDGVPTKFSSSQQALRRILHTYAAVNKGLGYVQGMNELVGHLLYCFSSGQSANVSPRVESDVFFCFQAMLGYLGDNFCRSLDFDRDIGVTSTIRNFEKLLRFVDSELADHLEDVQIKSEYYAFRWITLLFTQEFNVPDVFRIWDFLLSYGEDLRGAIFFTAAAMLNYQRNVILNMDNFGELLPMLQSYPSCDVNQFLIIAEEWIRDYGFGIVMRVKLASDEEIDAMRQEIDAKGEAALRAGETWMSMFKNVGRQIVRRRQ